MADARRFEGSERPEATTHHSPRDTGVESEREERDLTAERVSNDAELASGRVGFPHPAGHHGNVVGVLGLQAAAVCHSEERVEPFVGTGIVGPMTLPLLEADEIRKDHPRPCVGEGKAVSETRVAGEAGRLALAKSERSCVLVNGDDVELDVIPPCGVVESEVLASNGGRVDGAWFMDREQIDKLRPSGTTVGLHHAGTLSASSGLRTAAGRRSLRGTASSNRY